MPEPSPRATAMRRVLHGIASVIPYLLAAAAVSPFFMARLAPSMDVPAHLALAAVARGLSEGDPAIVRQFEWGVFVAPNTLFHAIAFVLGYVLPLTKVGVVIVSGAILLVIAGYTELAATFGRSRYTALALVPFAVQWALIEGLVDYVLGVALMAFALAAAVRYVDSGSFKSGVATFLLSGLVFMAHIQATLTYVACGVFLSVLAWRGRPLRGSFAKLARTLPVIVGLPIVLTFLWRFTSQEGLDRFTRGGSTQGNTPAHRIYELLEKGPFTLSDSNQGYLVSAGLFALVAGRFLYARYEQPKATVADGARCDIASSDGFLWGIVAGAMLAITFGPVNYGHYWHIGVRAISVLWWVCVVLAMPRVVAASSSLVPFLRNVLLVGGAGVAAVPFHGAIETWNGFTEGLIPVLRRAPHGSRLILLRSIPEDDGFVSDLYAHAYQYHTVLNHGTSTSTFGFYPGRIVREIDAMRLPQWVSPLDLQRYVDYGCFEYVLSRQGAARPDLRKVAESGKYTLYRIPNGCPQNVVAFRGGGDDSGETVAAFCRPGERLSGVRLTMDDRINLIDPVCGHPVDTVAGRHTDAAENPGGRRGAELVCPPNERFVGIGGEFDGSLSRVEIGCAHGDAVRFFGVGTPTDDDVPFRGVCPEGTEAGMLRMRRSSTVDRIEVGCVLASPRHGH